MSEMVEKKSKVKIDTSAISDILRKTNEELETASNEYLEMVKAEQLKKEETVEALNVTLENLKIKQETLNERLERLEGEEKEVIGKHKAIEKDIESKQSQIQSNLHAIKEETPEEHKELLTKMKKLISMNEKLKKKDSELRQQYRSEMESLQRRNEDAVTSLREMAAQDEQSDKHKELKEELNSKREILANVSKKCLELERGIDLIPSR